MRSPKELPTSESRRGILRENPRLEAIRQTLINDPNVFVGSSKQRWDHSDMSGIEEVINFPSRANEMEYSINVSPKKTLATCKELNNFCNNRLMPYFNELILLNTSSRAKLGKKGQLYIPSLEFWDKIADVVIKPTVVASNPEALALRPKFRPSVPEHTYPVYDELTVNVFPDPELLEFSENNELRYERDRLPWSGKVRERFPWVSNPDDLNLLFVRHELSAQLQTDLRKKPTT